MTLQQLLEDLAEIRQQFPSAMDMNIVVTNHERDVTYNVELADIINHGKQEICIIIDCDLSENSDECNVCGLSLANCDCKFNP